MIMVQFQYKNNFELIDVWIMCDSFIIHMNYKSTEPFVKDTISFLLKLLCYIMLLFCG